MIFSFLGWFPFVFQEFPSQLPGFFLLVCRNFPPGFLENYILLFHKISKFRKPKLTQDRGIWQIQQNVFRGSEHHETQRGARRARSGWEQGTRLTWTRLERAQERVEDPLPEEQVGRTRSGAGFWLLPQGRAAPAGRGGRRGVFIYFCSSMLQSMRSSFS